MKALSYSLVATGLLVSSGWSIARAMPPGAAGRAVREANQALAEIRVEDAARLLDGVAERHRDDPDALATTALVRFYQGDYDQATRRMTEALAGAASPARPQRRALYDLMLTTREAVDGFEETRSADGRFVVRHAPGKDSVLVPWALRTLRRAERVLQEDFGFRVPGPVRLEIYPSAASLAQVSSLTVDDIERTGTIALCKWDRVMITSPRALVRGYPWLDTIGHELVHLVLARASRDQAPVWFQEGVAKFLERRWRGEPGRAHIDPAVEAMLQQAVHSDKLIPFDKLHPSIARLASQDEAALAFAQVATLVESFRHRHGRAGLRAAVAEMAAGVDAKEALAQVAGEPWRELIDRWRGELRSRPRVNADAPRRLPLRFRGSSHGEDADVAQETARRAIRLGDLLWGHGRAAAATIEYEKAHRAAPMDPTVVSRFGQAALASGRSSQALEALQRIRDRHPEYAPVRALLGSALVGGRQDRPRPPGASRSDLPQPVRPTASLHTRRHRTERGARPQCSLLSGPGRTQLDRSRPHLVK